MTYLQGGLRGRFLDRDEAVYAILNRPYETRFYSTSVVGSSWSGRISDLPAHLTITIWGPDPVMDRQWRVTVKRGRRGFMVV